MSGEQGSVPTAMLPATKDEHDEVLELLKKATIGEYEILRELGRGGMATVYLAHDIALDRKVALKVMAPALALMGDGMSERFKREARTAASLSHPNIIPIYTVKSYQKTLFFVMKFIAGRSLESLMKDMGQMPVEMVRDLLQQVGTALGYAHRNGIVHRDVKPANIMIDEEGWAVVTDFGIAKVAENRGLTMTGIAVGTPAYMSPEQCAAKDITGKSDQYSLGVMAYEMLTGKQPFDGDSAMAMMFAHFHEPPKPVTEHRADIPTEVAGAVMRMLEKAPDSRWPSLEEALGAMGAEPLSHDDPMRKELVKAVRAKSNRAILDNLTPAPTSPIPPVKRKSDISNAATTPIPVTRVVAVGITPPSAQLTPGETRQLIATPKSSSGTTASTGVTWESSDPKIATVDVSGLVTAVAVGKATITARSEGVGGSASIEVIPVPVASVTVEPDAPSLVVDKTVQLKAVVRSAQGAELPGRTVTWSVAPAGVAQVSAAGLVTALKPGAAELTAECEGVKGTAKVTVTPPPVAGITLTPTERTVIVGDTAPFSAKLADAAGKPLTDRTIAWTSESPQVVAVSPRGIVTGLTVGSATIVARVEGQEAKAHVTVKPVPVASIVLEETAPFDIGSERQLVVLLKDAKGQLLSGREVTWTSSAPAVMSVVAGKAKAIAAGSAQITAESEGRRATVTLTVKAAPVPVPPPAPPPPAPEPKAAAAVTQEIVPPRPVPPPAPPEPKPVARKTEPAQIPDTAERKVPQPEPSGGMGKLIGIGVGVALLAAVGFFVLKPKSGGEIPPAPVAPVGPVVQGPAPVNEVTIGGDEGPLAVGRTRQLAARLKDAAGAELTDRAVTWTSSDPAIAEVSAIGAVTAKKAGSVTITAASEGKNDDFGVVVEEPAPSIEQPAAVATLALAGGSSKPLEIGQTAALSATAKDDKGATLADRTVVWSSSDPRVATVTSAGLVTATGAGKATITASSEGKSAEVKLSVNAPKPAPVARIDLTPDNPSVTAGQTVRLSAAAQDGQGKPLADRTIAWSSSNEQVARVGPDGTVTGVGKGNATISAASEGKSASTRVTVVEATVPVSSVMLSTALRFIKVGETTHWSATVRDPKGKELTDRTVSWTSSAPQVATVSGDGSITGVAPGTADIQVSVEGKTASFGITVTAAPAPPPVVATNPTPTNPPANPPANNPPANPGSGAGNAALIPRRAVAAGAAMSCGVATGGAVCWGAGYDGLTAIGGTAGLTGIAVGNRHACGLVSGGRAVCWGDNRAGQLGDGTASNASDTPVSVAGDLSFSLLSSGAAHTCGLAGGKAYCWGRNKDGQLGDGGTTDRRKPVAVKGGKTFVALSAGDKHTCGLTSSGQAYCWGDGFSGQLGYGIQESSTEPADVIGGVKFTRIAAGGQHTCGITAAGKAWCWGANTTGQLGDGSKSDRTQPVAVAGNLSFDDIAAGATHTCAITSGGEAYCWGENKSGQLGDGTKAGREKPVAVSGQGFTSISAGDGISCGMTRSGAMCWGRNEKGQLGDGGTAVQTAPVRVGG
ncbi:MAG: Ig-like domain-containing protein [Gemmatimonadales bacterium]